MKLRSEKEFWSGLLFAAVGAGFAIAALDLGLGTRITPGPGYFPLALGAITTLVGAVLLFKSLTLETEGGDRIGRWAIRPLLLIVGAVVGFGWALPSLGAIVALPLLVLLVLLAVWP